jgi:SAM-dependent methyltransferase
MNGAIWRVFADAPLESLGNGRPAFSSVFGTSFFEHAERDPLWGAAFDEAMTGATRSTAQAVLDAYDLADANVVVDVGGGRGHFLRAILERYPAARGIVFDLPHVADRARHEVASAGLLERLEVIGGSFFDAVPDGGDVYLLSWILHDWEDDRARAILRSCRDAIPPDGRLLVIEACIPPGNVPHPGKPLDMIMLVALGGRERTEAEYRELLASAGFRLARVIPTASAMSVIEAIPA